MPITSKWFNKDQSILYIKYEGRWTMSDYRHNISLNSNMIRMQSHPVVSIVDFTDGSLIPDKIIDSGQYSEKIGNDNNPANILFGTTPYIQVIVEILRKIFPKTTRGLMIVRTREEAIERAYQILQTAQEEV